MRYVQPRPSSIVAALYTLRDLDVDLAILHGPSGCSFKHARLLEEDGIRVLTTSLGDEEFIFGGQRRLEDVLRYAEEEFAPKKIAVVGTCVSMIIGEDMEAAIESSGISTPAIAVNIHAGFRENIDGVIAALEPAAAAGWISSEELERQRRVLAAANATERARGAACKTYISPSRGDLKHVAATELLSLARSGKRGLAIMNAKKETAYMFADELLALHDTVPDADITYVANLEGRGLPKVRGDAAAILAEMRERGVDPVLCGALDEYGENGSAIAEIIAETHPDFVLLVGVPHAVIPEALQGITVFSVTNGPRQVAPLKEQGHAYVMVEIDLHPKTLGVHEIVESEFGAVLRSVA
ncbi:MAG TPA: Ni-sirohydrochlorin a,c-diamide reductive cyclase catalytic subunit [Methanocorpusculum sp.]|nr:Ni-sirohydrochlorin a,c-diamide reductive cyclase catalytic subunit [Methanocorpusculum sp.]HJK20973.1 Ni-sirohydrochlorin a,c-diamide reductive cyclase catalytic subunit [Methanocorpusculum sp.]HJK25169.1 Ni-sirohydrochlorin a,c-diamide reductive cyclase catalytic subunit [Methanocorpusculum sp.]HJK26179.1 Ni-sirohydrochlorin a,c-diamide reductive cyclase catalytic subunit [Methanocorpusculum sp.]HJK28671.1 Ni-sirohydrochlorin a,c-diamide reductive cyclase catalytic subunit [Methanocorpuscu